MALVQATLEQALFVQFTKWSWTASDAARKLTDAYVSYVSTAQASVAFPLFTTLEGTPFNATLLQAMKVPAAGSSIKIAQAWASALLTFWTAPPIVFTGGGQTGSSLLFPGYATLITQLSTDFLRTNSAQKAANKLASALHLATMTIPVTLAPSGVTVTLT